MPTRQLMLPPLTRQLQPSTLRFRLPVHRCIKVVHSPVLTHKVLKVANKHRITAAMVLMTSKMLTSRK